MFQNKILNADKLNLVIPYSSDEQANAGTKDPQCKLVFRLLDFTIHDEEEGTSGSSGA